MRSPDSFCFRRSVAATLLAAFCVRPCPAAERVVLVSVDGLRPDAIEAAPATTLLAMIAGGSYHAAALNELPPATLPNHVTLLTGLPVAVHGVLENIDLPGHVWAATIFDVAAAAGLRCGFFASKSKLDFVVPLSPSAVIVIDSDQVALMDRVLEEFAADPFDLTFIHLREPDSTGHRAGWMSDEYLAAVQSSDEQIGRLLDLLRDMQLLDATDVLVTSDHGGEGLGHVLNTPAVREIPWIGFGPSFATGRRLCEPIAQPDTPATVLALLGLPVPDDRPGHAVAESFRDFEQPACQSQTPPLGPPCMVCPLAAAAALGMAYALRPSARRRRPGRGITAPSRANIAGAGRKTFKATAGGTPLRGLWIMPSMKLKVTDGCVIQDQTKQVRYLTELKVFGVLETAQPDGVIDGGDFLLRAHSLSWHNGSETRLQGGM